MENTEIPKMLELKRQGEFNDYMAECLENIDDEFLTKTSEDFNELHDEVLEIENQLFCKFIGPETYKEIEVDIFVSTDYIGDIK